MATPSLAMIPSAYADSKVYSVLPNNGDGDFTFNRDSSATRIGQNGLIQTVGFFGSELVPSIATIVNLGGGSITQISGNSYSSTSNGASGSTLRPKIDFATTSGKTYKLVITPIGAITGTINCDFYDGSSYLFNNYDFTTSKEIYFVDNGNVFLAFDGTQTYSIANFIVSVQELTGDQPRLNYDISNGVVQSCPSLLLEPASTNLVTYSEDLSNSSWNKQNGGTGSVPTVTSNYSVSPDGTQNADRVVFNLNNGTANADVSQLAVTIGSVSSANYSNSVYIKSNTANDYALVITEPSGGHHTKTITNQWQRFDASSSNATNVSFRIRLRGDESTSDYADVSIFGAQVEALTYATSYSPTNGSSQTRAAETCNGAGTASTFNSTEGVLYAEIKALNENGGNRYISLSNGTDLNRILLRFQDTDKVGCYVRSTSGSDADITKTSASISSNFLKVAVKWKTNDVALWVNGVEIGVDSSFTTFNANVLDRINFAGTNGTSQYFYGNTKDLRVYNEALTDAQLQTLTTL